MSSWQASTNWQTLQQRSAFFAQIREFFAERDCLEIQVPILQRGANIDHGVEVFQTDDWYLCTSPEHYLKRLLCDGAEDCFSISPCFRKHEHGSRHRQEFTMLEWYRRSWSLEQLMQECCALISSCCQISEIEEITYRDAFLTYCQLDPFTAGTVELQAFLNEEQITERGALLDLCVINYIEPGFNKNCITILRDYPASQAAQARCKQDEHGNDVAERFEIYAKGLELANAYHECADATTLQQRMQDHNPHNYKLDKDYFAALEHGLPDCCGVALGLDRLFMLSIGETDIARSMAFANH